MKNVLFGAGLFAKKAIDIVGRENIVFIVDNDKNKNGTKLEGIDIYAYDLKKNELQEYKIIIAVSEKYQNQIENQLKNDGFDNYCLLGEIQMEITKNKIANRFDSIAVYRKCIEWIKENSINNEAIICNTALPLGYPEVTGYYIPTLIRWGYRELALNYADWLISIQKEDGSWFDTNNTSPYVFDSAQVLRGLLAAKTIAVDTSKLDYAIVKGCDWLLSNKMEDGRLVTPSQKEWGEDDSVCSELIHLYCLPPIREAGIVFGKSEYIDAVEQILGFYKKNYYEKIINFSLLSHFYAYVMEALVDLGEIDMAKEAMERIAKLQKISGAVPAYNNVDWVCSTGLFQLALVWFKLGNIERGNRAFDYACRLQNETGGWFGSYLSEDNSNEVNSYFPNAEISWANKYFLDALYYKNKAEFNQWADTFLNDISKVDERYVAVRDEVIKTGIGSCILDVGCGKGRYLRNLLEDIDSRRYYAVDISENVLKNLSEIKVSCAEGTLTCIPYENDKFSVTYTCEALEHAVDIESAIKEMCRVTISGGIIVVVDKNDGCYGELEIGQWEQWPNEENLRNIMLKYCSNVQVKHGIQYENMQNKDLFSAWIGCVK